MRGISAAQKNKQIGACVFFTMDFHKVSVYQTNNFPHRVTMIAKAIINIIIMVLSISETMKAMYYMMMMVITTTTAVGLMTAMKTI